MPAGATLGLYVNVGDVVRLDAAELEWHDLAVDVLATPDGRFQVLDEEELPPDLDPVLRRHIEACRDRIVAELPTLIAEIEARTATLLHRVAERG